MVNKNDSKSGSTKSKNILEEIVEGGARLRPVTKASYLSAAREWLEFAGTDPDRWTPVQAQAFYRRLLTRMKAASAHGIFAGLRYVSRRWALVYGGKDFAAAVETLPDEPRKVPIPLTSAELRAFLDVCNGPQPADLRDRALLFLGAITGARRGGLSTIGFADFQPSRLGYETVSIELKGGRVFPIPLLPEVLPVLQPWSAWLTDQLGAAKGAYFRAIGTPQITGERRIGERALTLDAINKIFRRRSAQAGIRHVHPHDLRYTFITRCREANVPVQLVSAITGHAVGVIDSIYADPVTIGVKALETIRPVFADLFRDGDV